MWVGGGRIRPFRFAACKVKTPTSLYMPVVGNAMLSPISFRAEVEDEIYISGAGNSHTSSNSGHGTGGKRKVGWVARKRVRLSPCRRTLWYLMHGIGL